MTRQTIYRSTYPPPHCPTNLSLSQYLSQYNPDAVPKDKIILEDDWTGQALTYAGLRKEAARHAWSLREKYNLKAGDVVAVSAPNSVGLPSSYFCVPVVLIETNVGRTCSASSCCSLDWCDCSVSSMTAERSMGHVLTHSD
jgi:hypothetical protein